MRSPFYLGFTLYFGRGSLAYTERRKTGVVRPGTLHLIGHGLYCEVGEAMRRNVRARFWLESTLGGISAILFLITLVWPDWIELILKVDPDRGNGSVNGQLPRRWLSP